jgi:hypothetical protein
MQHLSYVVWHLLLGSLALRLNYSYLNSLYHYMVGCHSLGLIPAHMSAQTESEVKHFDQVVGTYP